MAQNDKNLEILINIVTQEVGSERAEDIINKYKAATEGATKEVHKHAGAARMLHQAFHGLNQILPGLGNVVSRLFHGFKIPVAAIVAMVVAAGVLHKVIEKIKEHMKEIREHWVEVHNAVLEATAAGEEYAHGIEQAKKAIDETAKVYEHDKALLDAMVADHKAMLDLQEKLALAAANGDKEKEAAVKKRFADLKKEYDITAETLELELKKGELQKRKKELMVAEDQSKVAEDKYEYAKSHPVNKLGDLKKLQEEAAKLHIDQLPAMKERYEETKRLYEQSHDVGLGRTMADLGGRIADAEKAKKQLEAVEAYTESLKVLKRTADETASKYKGLIGETDKLNEAVKTGVEVLKKHATTAFKTEHGEQAGGELSHAVEIATRKLPFGQHLSKEDDAYMRTIASMLTGTNQNSAQAKKLLETIAKHPENMSKILERLLGVMEGMGANYTKFEARIKSLENTSRSSSQ